jgi:hypothetical protein
VSIDLGAKVREKVTTMEGIAIGRAEYLYGSPSVLVQPEALKDGVAQKPQWLEEAQLEVIG